jgi:hypothetical protein
LILKKKEGGKKESLHELQDRFISRPEHLLKIFHERIHIQNGLKTLSDREVI